jgi:hypothetical protein
MVEYLKRDDALRALEQINPVDYGAMWDYEAHHYSGECLRDCKEAIDSIPAADVAPVVHGRWVDGKCSNCGVDIPTDDAHDAIFENECRFCYYCGAKMDGGDRDAVD